MTKNMNKQEALAKARAAKLAKKTTAETGKDAATIQNTPPVPQADLYTPDMPDDEVTHLAPKIVMTATTHLQSYADLLALIVLDLDRKP